MSFGLTRHTAVHQHLAAVHSTRRQGFIISTAHLAIFCMVTGCRYVAICMLGSPQNCLCEVDRLLLVSECVIVHIGFSIPTFAC